MKILVLLMFIPSLLCGDAGSLLDYNVGALLPPVHDTFTSKTNIPLTLDVPAADKWTGSVLTELEEQLGRPHSGKSATFENQIMARV